MSTRLVFKSCCAATAGVLLMATAAVLTPRAAGSGLGPLVYGVNPYDNLDEEGLYGLQSFEADNGKLIEGKVITVTSGPRTGDTVLNAQGLAIDPTTGDAWAILRFCDFGCRVRYLAELSLDTGEATTIDQVVDQDGEPQRIASITFDDAGVLYGVSGDGSRTGDPGLCPECLYTIDKTTADATKVATLGNGGDGEAIAFNPLNDQIYHASGGLFSAAPLVFERIDPSNAFAVTNIPYQGDPIDQVFGMVFEPDEAGFLVTDINRDVSRVTTNGFVTTVSTLSRSGNRNVYLRGLGIVEPTLPVAVPDAIFVAEDSGVTTHDVRENDLDGATPVGTVVSVTQPDHGTAGVAPFGAGVTYSPDPGFCTSNSGFPDRFTYELDTGSSTFVEVTIVCPNIERTLSIKYSTKRLRFTGTISATDPVCVIPENVTIRRVTTSGDTDLGTVVSDDDGKYVFKKRVGRGRYYSVINNSSVPNEANCNSANSPIIKVTP